MIRSLLLAVFLLIAVSLHAQTTLRYGFDGDLSEVLEELTGLADNTYPMQQVAGRLIYHNDGVAAADSTTLFQLKGINPSLAVPWTLMVDVTIPLTSDFLLQPGGNSECNLTMGVANLKDGSVRFFTLESSRDATGAREIKASAGVDGNEPFVDEGRKEELRETVQLRITYAAGAFTVLVGTAGSGSNSILAVDIDPGGESPFPDNIIDWGLEPTDEFILFLGARSENYPIAPERPLQFDNLYFTTHAPLTGPGEIIQNPDLMSVDVKSFPTGLTELKKSHDLENWITIKTLYRGITETMFLPSDGGKAFYKVERFSY